MENIYNNNVIHPNEINSFTFNILTLPQNDTHTFEMAHMEGGEKNFYTCNYLEVCHVSEDSNNRYKGIPPRNANKYNYFHISFQEML